MNKKVLLIGGIIGVAVIAGAVVTFAMMGSKKSDSGEVGNSTGISLSSYKAIKACDLFTLAEAKEVLGENAEAGDNTVPQSSDDINVDTCTYTVTGTKLDDSKGASVLVRSPLTADGVTSNKEGFDSTRPQGSETVDGYGEAYFNPSFGQLNVYKDGVWYIITNGQAFHPDQSTLADAKLVADKVLK